MDEDNKQNLIDENVVDEIDLPTPAVTAQKKIIVKTHGYNDDQNEQFKKIISITGLPQPPKLKPIPVINSSATMNVSKAPELLASKTYAAARAKLVPETNLKVINRSSMPALTPQPQQLKKHFPSSTTITIKSNRTDNGSTAIISNNGNNSSIRNVKILQTTGNSSKSKNSQFLRIPMPQTSTASAAATTLQIASASTSTEMPSDTDELKIKSNELPENWKIQLKQQCKRIHSKMGNEFVPKEIAEALNEFKKWQKENDPNGTMNVIQLNKKFNEFIQLYKPQKHIIKKPSIQQNSSALPTQSKVVQALQLHQQQQQQKRKSIDEENAQLKRVKLSSSRSSSSDSVASTKTLPEATTIIKTEEQPSCKRSEHDSLYHLLRSDATKHLQKRKAELNVSSNGNTANVQISNGKLSDPKGPIRLLEKLSTKTTTLAHVIPQERPASTKSKDNLNTNFLCSGLTARTKAKRKRDLNEFQEKINKIFSNKNVTNQAIERIKSSPRRTANGRSKSLGSNGVSQASKPRFKLPMKSKRFRLGQSASFDENDADKLKIEPLEVKIESNDEDYDDDDDDDDGNNDNNVDNDVDNNKDDGFILMENNIMDNLSASIEWNGKTGKGKIDGLSINFRRNEFGLIEAIEQTAEPKSYYNKTKLKANNDKDNNANGYKFDSLIRRIENAETATINNCKPHEYYSNEFQSLILSMVQKDDHHCNLIKAKEIVLSLANKSKKSLQEKSKKDEIFDWNKFLLEQNTNTVNKQLKFADNELFKNSYPKDKNYFAIGHKLEAIDPKNCSLFCVCTVVGIRGYRIKLHFDGYHSSYDFWTNADSKSIFPVGWCNKTGRELQPPHRRLSNRENKFKWDDYLIESNSSSAPKHCFSHLNTSITNKNPFKIGKKLEADDVNFTQKICVATIGDVIDTRILITFDGFEETSNYWTDITSPYIHPINWHCENGFSIQTPPGWQDFKWEDYLKVNRAEGVPAHAFCTRNPIEFSTGMLIEIVDKKNPMLIRPAKILMTYEYEIKVLFIGWPEEYAYWIEDDSPEIHPIGWCEKTNHSIELPPDSKNTNHRNGCGIFGCRGIGNAKRPEFTTHSLQTECPYDMKNWQINESQPNRIDRIKRTNISFNTGASACRTRLPAAAVADQHTHISLQPLLNPTELANMLPKDVEMFRRLQVSTKFLLENVDALSQQHNKWLSQIKPLTNVKTSASLKNPLNWTTEEVSTFVSNLPNCSMLGQTFVEHEIDGLAFLSLRQADLIDIMGLSLGSAIKIFNRIIYLREECNTHYIQYE